MALRLDPSRQKQLFTDEGQTAQQSAGSSASLDAVRDIIAQAANNAAQANPQGANDSSAQLADIFKAGVEAAQGQILGASASSGAAQNAGLALGQQISDNLLRDQVEQDARDSGASPAGAAAAGVGSLLGRAAGRIADKAQQFNDSGFAKVFNGIHRVTSTFLDHLGVTGQRPRATSPGVDWATPTGTQVFAPEDGVVESVFTDRYGSKSMWVRSADGNRRWLYLHLDDWDVQQGQNISSGDPIAKSGNSGYVCGSNGCYRGNAPGEEGAHLSISVQENGQWVDPMRFLSNLGLGDGEGEGPAYGDGDPYGWSDVYGDNPYGDDPVQFGASNFTPIPGNVPNFTPAPNQTLAQNFTPVPATPIPGVNFSPVQNSTPIPNQTLDNQSGPHRVEYQGNVYTSDTPIRGVDGSFISDSEIFVNPVGSQTNAPNRSNIDGTQSFVPPTGEINGFTVPDVEAVNNAQVASDIVDRQLAIQPINQTELFNQTVGNIYQAAQGNFGESDMDQVLLSSGIITEEQGRQLDGTTLSILRGQAMAQEEAFDLIRRQTASQQMTELNNARRAKRAFLGNSPGALSTTSAGRLAIQSFDDRAAANIEQFGLQGAQVRLQATNTFVNNVSNALRENQSLRQKVEEGRFEAALRDDEAFQQRLFDEATSPIVKKELEQQLNNIDLQNSVDRLNTRELLIDMFSTGATPTTESNMRRIFGEYGFLNSFTPEEINSMIQEIVLRQEQVALQQQQYEALFSGNPEIANQLQQNLANQ